MNRLIAWRILVDEKGRSILAISGTFVAILAVFLELGFYTSVPRGGLLFYDAMHFDLMLTSSAYVSQANPGEFPRRRLYQAMALPEIAGVAALYEADARWVGDGEGLDLFVMGFDPDDPVLHLPAIVRARDVLRREDTILVDVNSRPEFGALRPGRRVEIEERAMTIGGTYNLGTGLLGLGVGLVSDQNFIRLFPNRTLSEVNLGLVTLRPGADPRRAAAELRAMMPADTRVFTRAQLARHETAYWVTQTSVGLVFGFGVIITLVVGLVILNQTLASQISRHLPEYATLKALGYSDRALGGVVGMVAAIVALIGYVPALGASTVIYSVVRRTTLLPVAMTEARATAVLAATLAISAASTLLALRSLRRADPVDLF
jgi:putative ABC transport system permease protein